MFGLEAKLQVLLLTVEAVAFLGLAAWCLRRTADGRWTVLGAAGAGLLGLSLGIAAVSDLENVFLQSSHIAINLYTHAHVTTVLIVARAVGALLLVLGFVEQRRPVT